MITFNKNGATAATVTPLRIHAAKERKMHGQSSTIHLDLTSVAIEQSNPVYRNGLWFEKSGASMAVYELYPSPYPNPLPPDYRPEPSLLRVDLRDESYRTFLEAIDEFLMARYLLEVA